MEELQDKLRERLMVRRLKADVLKDLPPKRRQVIEIPANGAEGIVAEEHRIYSQHREWIEDLERRLAEAEQLDDRDLIDDLCGELGRAKTTAFTEMSKVRHAVALAKVPFVVEHVENALEGGAVICFAWHKDVVAAIAEPFGHRAATMTGDTSVEERQAITDRFQAGEYDLIVANMQVGGTGWTWTRSSHVVFAELDWVPGNLSQAEDRCHRIGQAESVLVQHLVLEDSLDAEMAGKLIRKQEVIGRALDCKPEIEAASGAEEIEIEARLTDEQVQEAAVEVIVPEEADGPAEKQIEAAREGLRKLDGVCDGAQALDGQGFNKWDSRFGKELAFNSEWTPKQAEFAIKLCVKYQRQLGPELVAQAKGD